MTFEETVQRVEAAGYSWAVEGHPDKSYMAIVERGRGMYVADSLTIGLGAESGATPAEALSKAFETRR